MTAQIIPLPAPHDLDRRTQEAQERVRNLETILADLERFWGVLERDYIAAVRHAQDMTRASLKNAARNPAQTLRRDARATVAPPSGPPPPDAGIVSPEDIDPQGGE